MGGDETLRLRQYNKVITELLQAQFKHVARAWDGEKVARDMVDIICPEMTEEEMQAAWTIIRFCKRFECAAKAAIADLQSSYSALATNTGTSEQEDGRHATNPS